MHRYIILHSCCYGSDEIVFLFPLFGALFALCARMHYNAFCSYRFVLFLLVFKCPIPSRLPRWRSSHDFDPFELNRTQRNRNICCTIRTAEDRLQFLNLCVRLILFLLLCASNVYLQLTFSVTRFGLVWPVRASGSTEQVKYSLRADNQFQRWVWVCADEWVGSYVLSEDHA